MKKLLFILIAATALFAPLAAGGASYNACQDISASGACEGSVSVEYDGLVPCGREDILGGEMPCQLCHIFILFKRIIDFFLLPPSGLIWLIALLMIVAAGFLYIVGYVVSGDAGLVRKANQILTTTFVGLSVTLVSWIVINVFFIALGVADWTNLKPTDTGGWFEINCPVEVAPVGPD